VEKEIIVEWEIIEIYRRSIIFILIVDNISITFLCLVRLISSCVLIFSGRYIANEQFNGRFLILVLLFVLSIFLLIFRPNIISLLLGWDGLGVTSYLLVIFYQRNKSYNAGIITAITNRLGDVGILIVIGLRLSINNWNILTLYYERISSEKIILIIILVSACTKSAQIPFSAWLPAAMAAPTPVSALVHSSTLVTAGVYLLIRFSIIINNLNLFLLIICVRVCTILIAGMAAIFEQDIKKIIALSTLRQLGVIIITVRIQIRTLAFFHLLSHAYFKAILFMCAGSIIHSIKDYQDIRNIGINTNHSPIINSMAITSNLRLCGIPFLRGFYSKDLILERIIIMRNRIIIILIVIFATILTIAYSVRIILLLNISNTSESLFIFSKNDILIFLGIFGLYPFSILGGLLLNWNLLPELIIIWLPTWIKNIIFVILGAGVFLRFIIFKVKIIFNNNLLEFIKIIIFLPYSYNITSLKYSMGYGKINYKMCDLTWIESLYYKLNLFYSYKYSNYFSKISFYFLISSVYMLILIILLLII